MGEVQRYPEGTFCWVDLVTRDLAAAKRFYGSLHRWEYQEMSPTYALCRVDGRAVTGIYARDDLVEVEPQWNNYVAVNDADAIVRRAAELGAEVVEKPFDVDGDGRTAVLRDPSGALVALWQPGTHVGAGLVNEPGSLTWNDLVTSDLAAAKEFYARLFGWEASDVADGQYVSLARGELLIGGMQPIRPERAGELHPHWLPYFVVENADDAVRTVTDNGGTLVVGPNDVPAGRFAVIRDPFGAISAISQMGAGGPSRGVDSVEPARGSR